MQPWLASCVEPADNTSAEAAVPHVVFAPGTPEELVQSYDDLEAKAGLDLFSFSDSARWNRTSASSSTLRQGDPTVIRWSIAPDGTPISGYSGEPSAPSNLRSFFAGIYGASSSSTRAQDQPWFGVVQQVFDRWSAVSGVTYVYEPNDDGAAISANNSGVVGVRGDVRLSGHTIDGTNNVLAYNFFPTVGDLVLDTGDSFFTNTSGNSIRLRNTLAHELGHGLGLDHVTPVNGTKLMEPSISLGFDGPQADDILAINRGYGDRLEKNGGNDTFTTASSLGGSNSFTVDTVSIDDDSDVDWFKITVGAGASLSVQMTPTGSTYNSNGSTFNSLTQNNLALAVFGTNGTTLLASSTSGGAGVAESISNLALPGAGTYFVRVTGTANAAQMYRLAGSVTNVAAGTPEIAVFDGTTEVPDNTGSVNLGTATVGAAATRTFSIVNSGQANLVLGSTITLPAGFVLTQGLGTTTLVPGASTTFTVALTTASTGTFTGQVSLNNNDADENPYSFTIAGTVRSTPTPPAANPTFSDTFNRANSTALGSNWTERGGNLAVSGNRLASASSGESFATVNNLSFSDAILKADVVLGTGSATREAGLVVRQSGTGTGNQYWGGLRHSGGRYVAEIWEANGGTWTRLSTAAVSSGTASLQFEVIGTSLKLFVNGVLTNSATDGTLTSGRMGAAVTGTAPRLDNFSVSSMAPAAAVSATAGSDASTGTAGTTDGSAAAQAWLAAVDQILTNWNRSRNRIW